MKEITDINQQKLSTLIGCFFICDNCGIVDEDLNRMQTDYLCPNCRKSSKGAKLFLKFSIITLIDLIQEFYNLKTVDKVITKNSTDVSENNHRLAIVIFYCSIAEILMDQFLENLMEKLKIPDKLQEKLLYDYHSFPKKLGLYNSLTNANIADDAKFLTENSKINFIKIVNFNKNIRNLRNQFLHKGYDWCISDEMPEKCLKNLRGLLVFFVSLHNKYISEKSN